MDKKVKQKSFTEKKPKRTKTMGKRVDNPLIEDEEKTEISLEQNEEESPTQTDELFMSNGSIHSPSPIKKQRGEADYEAIK